MKVTENECKNNKKALLPASGKRAFFELPMMQVKLRTGVADVLKLFYPVLYGAFVFSLI